MILSLMQQSRGGIAVPAIRMREHADESRAGEIAELGQDTRFDTIRDQSVDAPGVAAGV